MVIVWTWTGMSQMAISGSNFTRLLSLFVRFTLAQIMVYGTPTIAVNLAKINFHTEAMYFGFVTYNT